MFKFATPPFKGAVAREEIIRVADLPPDVAERVF
jgi:hypothetical protein